VAADGVAARCLAHGQVWPRYGPGGGNHPDNWPHGDSNQHGGMARPYKTPSGDGTQEPK
jgi:hypothetical protein